MSRHIVIVNNQLGTATILGIMLERSGFTVMRIDNALAALKVVEEITPDLFIISATLPGINGIELCKQIRLQSRLMHIPVIILASRGDLSEIEQGFEAGANDCLIQPVLCHDLLVTIQRVSQLNEHTRCTAADCIPI
ncbi:MAG: response regulator [Anaerolineae bacterium]|nr:response regulator [Anaerolineae bacterium]